MADGLSFEFKPLYELLLPVSLTTDLRIVLHNVKQTNQASRHHYRVFRTQITGSSFCP